MRKDMENEKQRIRLFRQLYDDYHSRFVRFAATYVGMTAAEDIVADCMLYYWEHSNSMESQHNIPAYVLTIVKHRCLNHLERIRKEREINNQLKNTNNWELDIRIHTLQACNPERLFSDELQRLVSQAIARLPDQTRDIFMRSRYEDQSHKEIADAFGISTKAVEYHITKALRSLRIALKDYLPIWVIQMMITGN